MKFKPPFLLFLSFWLLISPIYIHAQSHVKNNLKHLYDPFSPLHIQSKTFQNGTRTSIFLQLKTNWLGQPEEIFSASYSTANQARPNYSFKTDLPLAQHLIHRNGKLFYYHFEIDNRDNHRLLLLEFTTLDKRQFFLFPIPLTDDTNAQLIKVGQPEIWLKGFIRPSELKKIFEHSPSFRLAEQEKNFKNALNPNFKHKKLKIFTDTSYLLTINSRKLTNLPAPKGLYLSLLESPNNREFLTLKLVQESFPKYTRYEELLPPLVYLADEKEVERLKKTKSPKESFEKFWLKKIVQEENAALSIKRYYQYVHLANEFFTTYKDGWKTDQGMVFILFGPPDEVYQKRKKEIWIYRNQEEKSKIRFTFVKKYGLFNSPEYKLKRPKRYEGDWYRAKDLWRKGIKKI